MPKEFIFDKKIFDKIIEDYMNFISWKDIVSKYNIPQSTINKYLCKEYDFEEIKEKRRKIDFENKLKIIIDNNSDIKLNKESENTLTFDEYKDLDAGCIFWVKCNTCGEYVEKTLYYTINHKNFGCMNCRGKKISNSQKFPYKKAIKPVHDLGCKISLNKKDELKENEWGRVVDSYWFTCSECGNWLFREYRAFIKGSTKCSDCGMTKWDIDKAKRYAEELGLTMISNEWYSVESEYEFICPKCGKKFKRRFGKIQIGRILCGDCLLEKRGIKKRRFTPKEYKKYVKDNFNIECVDDYKNVDYPIYHICPSCGGTWKISPTNLYKQEIRICTKCSAKRSSSGELTIQSILEELKLSFLKEYTFDDLGRYRFDFSIIDEDNKVKFLIEFDGKQHFEPIEYFGGIEDFEKTKERDRKKEEYCADNNIPLLRIPYWEVDNSKDIIINFSKEVFKNE